MDLELNILIARVHSRIVRGREYRKGHFLNLLDPPVGCTLAIVIKNRGIENKVQCLLQYPNE